MSAPQLANVVEKSIEFAEQMRFKVGRKSSKLLSLIWLLGGQVGARPRDVKRAAVEGLGVVLKSGVHSYVIKWIRKGIVIVDNGKLRISNRVIMRMRRMGVDPDIVFSYIAMGDPDPESVVFAAALAKLERHGVRRELARELLLRVLRDGRAAIEVYAADLDDALRKVAAMIGVAPQHVDEFVAEVRRLIRRGVISVWGNGITYVIELSLDVSLQLLRFLRYIGFEESIVYLSIKQWVDRLWRRVGSAA